MFIIKNKNGNILETCKEEEFNEDYREVVSYAHKKYGLNYTLETGGMK